MIETTLVKKAQKNNRASGNWSSLIPSFGQVITIAGTQLPNEVGPNKTIDASVKIQDNAADILPTDPNACNLSSFTGGAGLSIRAELLVNGNRVNTATRCVPGGGGTKTLPLSWTTPGPSTKTSYNVTYNIYGAGSGNKITSKSETVTVTSAAPSQAKPGSSGQPSTSSGSLINLGGLGKDVQNAASSGGSIGFILDHPVESAAIGIGGAIVLSTLTNTLASRVP